MEGDKLTKNPENCIPSKANVAVNNKIADCCHAAGQFDSSVRPITIPTAPAIAL